MAADSLSSSPVLNPERVVAASLDISYPTPLDVHPKAQAGAWTPADRDLLLAKAWLYERLHPEAIDPHS